MSHIVNHAWQQLGQSTTKNTKIVLIQADADQWIKRKIVIDDNMKATFFIKGRLIQRKVESYSLMTFHRDFQFGKISNVPLPPNIWFPFSFKYKKWARQLSIYSESRRWLLNVTNYRSVLVSFRILILELSLLTAIRGHHFSNDTFVYHHYDVKFIALRRSPHFTTGYFRILIKPLVSRHIKRLSLKLWKLWKAWNRTKAWKKNQAFTANYNERYIIKFCI